MEGVHWTISWFSGPLASLSQGWFRRKRPRTRPILSHRGANFGTQALGAFFLDGILRYPGYPEGPLSEQLRSTISAWNAKGVPHSWMDKYWAEETCLSKDAYIPYTSNLVSIFIFYEIIRLNIRYNIWSWYHHIFHEIFNIAPFNRRHAFSCGPHLGDHKGSQLRPEPGRHQGFVKPTLHWYIFQIAGWCGW